MKKIAAFILGGMIVGTAATSVSAAEYEVQKGDSLWNIAEEHNTSVEELVEINQLATTVIQPKQTIVMYESYVVEKGDTLSGIAKEFDVTVEEIKEWNELESSIIGIGQELTIHAAKDNSEDKESAKEAKKTTNETNDKSEATSAAKESTQSKQVKKQEEKTASKKQDGKTISVSATAYTAKCTGCSGITATGVDLNSNPNAKVIAVDPNVIPLGSKVHVEGYGEAIAADTGGAINGNKIDIHVPTKDQAYSWGVRNVNVTILD
ncbi:LysM peptidoglycan-binding domain-containing protein [Virgibacillus sp. W0181]|uniref:LysM peptidoglycan-binding domain-containing protein n=1 Tax=Virgibacillus sp. W0181 TaxID=3391581 RepID=UPI003F48BA25